MEAFFFGSSEHPLYGVYHAAAPAQDRFEGIVICPPFGQEYMRSHRALRMLADSLSKKGFHVLRFDYRGTGNSALDLKDVSPEMWIEDITIACNELRDVSATTKISLVGLRLGALLAGNAIANDPANVHQLVLWDPIIDGEHYLNEVKNEIANSDSKIENNFISAEEAINFNGFAMTKTFQDQLLGLQLATVCRESSKAILLIASHENSAFQELKHEAKDNPSFKYQLTPAPYDWNYVDFVGGIMLPLPIMNATTEWFTHS